MGRTGWLLMVVAMWGTANFLMKVVGSRISSASGVLGIVIGYSAIGLWIALSGGGRIGTGVGYLGALAVGALYIGGNYAYLRLAQREDISAIAPIGSLTVVIPVALGFLLLGEPMTLRKLVGFACALAAVVLLR